MYFTNQKKYLSKTLAFICSRIYPVFLFLHNISQLSVLIHRWSWIGYKYFTIPWKWLSMHFFCESAILKNWDSISEEEFCCPSHFHHSPQTINNKINVITHDSWLIIIWCGKSCECGNIFTTWYSRMNNSSVPDRKT